MKTTKMLTYIILLVIVIFYTCPLTLSKASPYTINALSSGDKEIQVVDALGRTIVLGNKPTRIISLAPSITEILFYMGLEDYIVGVDSISYNDTYYGIKNYVERNNIVDVGGYWWSSIKIEEILKLEPDLILADKGAHQPLLQTFESYNLTVVYLNGGSSSSINDIYFDFDLIAKIYGLEGKVVDFINKVEKTFETYREKLDDYHNLSVLVIVGVYNGIWVAGRATYIDDIILRLGLKNAANTTGWKAVGIEEIYEWSPNVILIASGSVTEKTLRDLGIYNLGVPVIFLDKEGVDSLSRPGPLILNAPKKIYDAFLHSVNLTSTPKSLVEGLDLMLILTYSVPALILGFIIGFLTGRSRR